MRWHEVAGPDGPGLKVCSDDGILAALLHELDALFVELSGMPPPRSRDHCINLLPGSVPVAVRPYHYPASHEDELERQCAAMLARGSSGAAPRRSPR